ncbi:MAG: hypothetical protein ACLGIK_14795 [Gemmatimonadota bacterium]
MDAQTTIHPAQQPVFERAAPARELRDSLVLLALTASSLGAYLGVAAAAVRLFAAR